MATKKVNLNNEGELQPEVVLDMLAKRGLIAENAADPERIKKAKQEQKKQAYALFFRWHVLLDLTVQGKVAKLIQTMSFTCFKNPVAPQIRKSIRFVSGSPTLAFRLKISITRTGQILFPSCPLSVKSFNPR